MTKIKKNLFFYFKFHILKLSNNYLISKGEIELQVMTNCLLDLQKMFTIVEVKGILIFFYLKKKFVKIKVDLKK